MRPCLSRALPSAWIITFYYVARAIKLKFIITRDARACVYSENSYYPHYARAIIDPRHQGRARARARITYLRDRCCSRACAPGEVTDNVYIFLSREA